MHCLHTSVSICLKSLLHTVFTTAFWKANLVTVLNPSVSPYCFQDKYKFYSVFYEGTFRSLRIHEENRFLRSSLLRTLVSQKLLGNYLSFASPAPHPACIHAKGTLTSRVSTARCHHPTLATFSYPCPDTLTPYSVILKWSSLNNYVSVHWFMLFLYVLNLILCISHLAESFKTVSYSRLWVSCCQE